MRATTLVLLVGLVFCVGTLAWSVQRAGSRAAVGDGGPTVLTFAAWGGAEEMRQLRELVVDPINRRQDDYRIRLIPIPSDYHTKLATMMAGDTPPDLFYLGQEYVPAFAGQGALLDLTDRIAADDRPVTDLAGYYPAVLERYRHEGRIVGLPWIAQPVVLYCNVEHFRDAGVELPDAARGRWTWHEFVDAGRRLTRDTTSDGRIDRWGFILDGWPPVSMFIWQAGGEWVDETGRVNWSDPAVAEALDFYGGLVHRKRIAPPLSVVAEAGFSDLFRAGRVAMFMGGAADDLDRLEHLDVVTTEVPAGPDGTRATFCWTAGLHVSVATADADAAFKAWGELLEAIHRWKIPAPRPALAAELEHFEPRKADAADAIRASMDYMRTTPPMPRQVQWETLVSEELIDPLLRTGAPAETLLARARERLRGWD